ncbi:predicted protein [Micromonas commoda]|uniref:Uncharacterized protein n=1 Tax=Micromonas commoda (strain RCC299 / NOUM17 / CCMP2709) TaxID=296587 RepID=C1E054_MICCC|nr:predicted protein [Micromonas commoda]ACO61243.1 predicted protein [Micromonas commoda]|eukprot:XP_002499985.1 predicted protein [Micromonas commoda]
MSAKPMLLDSAEQKSTRWNNPLIDALPYADVLPEGWRETADQLVQEEMRRMTKRPKDYLAEMAPAKEIDWSKCPLLEPEFRRVEKGTGEKIAQPDNSRYNLDPPPKSKRDDPEAWEKANNNAKAQLEHQKLRIENLELMMKFAPNAWRAHNAMLEAAIKRVEKEVAAKKKAIEEINTMRSVKQKEAGREIAKLEKQWYAQCAKNIAIDADIQRMELEIARLEAEQGKGVDGAAAASAGKKRKAEAEAPEEEDKAEAPEEEDKAEEAKAPEEEKTSPSPRGRRTPRNSKGSAEKAQPPESPARKSPRASGRRTPRNSKGSK